MKRWLRYVLRWLGLRRLEALWLRDEYTGLMSRQAWTRAYEQLQPTSGGLLLVDVDNFKCLNDKLGHVEGDKALRHVARILEREAAGCLVGRYGGDETAVYVPRAEAATGVAERVRHAIERDPMLAELRQRASIDRCPFLTVSVGVAPVIWNRPLAALMADADIACSAAKSDGRNTIRQYRG